MMWISVEDEILKEDKSHSEIFDDFEDDPVLDSYRERRLEELRFQYDFNIIEFHSEFMFFSIHNVHISTAY